MVNYTINNKIKLLFSLLIKRLRQKYFRVGKSERCIEILGRELNSFGFVMDRLNVSFMYVAASSC